MSYARGTGVPVRNSRMEIEQMLEKHRATRQFTAQEAGRAIVGFVVDDRMVQFELELPVRGAFETRIVRGRRVKQSQGDGDRAWEQACREKWRALVLALKSKFVSIETGIETTEQAFLAHIILPNKQTVHRWFKQQLAEAYDTQGMPPLLGAGEPHS
jgi:hypothetical protein